MTADYDRWTWLCVGLDVKMGAKETYEYLECAYDMPEGVRAYHTLKHVSECLDHLDDVGDLIEFPQAVELAIWFHDCFYHPAQNDNEETSAATARGGMEAMEIPKPIAKVNPLRPAPPKMYIIRTTINVVNDVKSVLDSV